MEGAEQNNFPLRLSAALFVRRAEFPFEMLNQGYKFEFCIKQSGRRPIFVCLFK